jgi:hypothetical protein
MRLYERRRSGPIDPAYARRSTCKKKMRLKSREKKENEAVREEEERAD